MTEVVPPTAAAFGLTPAARRALLARAFDADQSRLAA